MSKIRVTQIRSTIEQLERHKRTIEALGLGKPGRTVVHEDTPQIRGMVTSVLHLITVEPEK